MRGRDWEERREEMDGKGHTSLCAEGFCPLQVNDNGSDMCKNGKNRVSVQRMLCVTSANKTPY